MKQRIETRSDTKRHWDIITMISLTTAAMAAVFFILESQTAAGIPIGQFQATVAAVAMMLYIGAATLAGIAVFAGTYPEQTAHDTFTIFWTILLPLALIVFVQFILPPWLG